MGVSAKLTRARRLRRLPACMALLGLAVPAAPQAPPAQQQETKPQEPAAATLPKGKRLILKDGSFQVAREWERKGDRVRYWSVERSAWEELPADFIDWDATAKAEAEDARKREELVQQIKDIRAAERTADIDVDASIEVAPGIFLPDNEGLYLVDKTFIIPLVQVGADLKLNKGRRIEQIFVPLPVLDTKHRIQVAGKEATIRISNAQPEFYIRTSDAHEPEMELLKAQVKGTTREFGTIRTDLVGQQSTERNALSILRERMAKGVYRIRIEQSVQPGEYALVEILPEGMNLMVWDFGVDPPAPPKPPAGVPPRQQTAKPPSKPQ